MTSSKAIFAVLILFAVMFSNVVSAVPITGLYYTSSPTSKIGAGETVFVTPNDGFDVFASFSAENAVFLAVNDFASNPNFPATRSWNIDLAAPANQILLTGHYPNATRYPFQDPAVPGLSFVGNNRGDTTLTGFFDILELAVNLNGEITSFAANFTQFDEGQTDWWNRGSIRFNSEIPIQFAVPEPNAILLFVVSFLMCISLASRLQAPRLRVKEI